jgi:hypothetical protein
MSEEFGMNFKRCLQINVTPESTATWATLAKGIDSADWSSNDELSQKKHWSGQGWGSTACIGKQFTCSVAGDRVIGNAAQDYIVGLQSNFAGETQVREYDETGGLISGNCSIVNINANGTSGQSTFTCEIHINGKPTITPRVAATNWSTPAAFAAGSVTGTTKATITKTSESNTLGFVISAAAKTAYVNGFIDGLFAYTSGADIEVLVDQYVTIYELDENERIVKYVSHKVLTAEIAE